MICPQAFTHHHIKPAELAEVVVEGRHPPHSEALHHDERDGVAERVGLVAVSPCRRSSAMALRWSASVT